VGDDERAVLLEISNFLQKSKLPSPLPFPDLASERQIDGENFAGGLLNFSPPDALSILAVRADPQVARYAARVRPLLARPTSFETQCELVHAMREAQQKSERAKQCSKVFEVTSWVCKPLHYVPGIDIVASAFDDLRDILKKWIERKDERECKWYLIGPRMYDVSLNDYLRRQGNL
jgi:hypothetical protein